MIGPYKTATSFRVALEERLRQRSLATGTPLDRLRKEVALQRLIARMAQSDQSDGWVLKGAQVLLVRLDEKARATKDLDTTWRYEAAALSEGLDDATALDLGDGFVFEVGTGSRLAAESDQGGWRYSVRALLTGGASSSSSSMSTSRRTTLGRSTCSTFVHWSTSPGSLRRRSPPCRSPTTSRRSSTRTAGCTRTNGRRAA